METHGRSGLSKGTRILGRFENETPWLTQALIADFFQITVPTVDEHLKGIFAESELEAGATIRKFRIVRQNGVRESATCKDYLQVRTRGPHIGFPFGSTTMVLAK